MAKYKIEIEIDVDFEKIFSEIPEGLFEKGVGVDEHYERECISDTLRDTYLHSLDRKTTELAKDAETGLYKYLKHHLECNLAVSKQISNNFKLTKLA